MSTYTFSQHSPAVNAAKLSRRVKPPVVTTLRIIGLVLLVLAIAGALTHHSHMGLIAGPGLLLVSLALWLGKGVIASSAAPIGTTTRLELLLPPNLAAKYQPNLDGAGLWQLLADNWEARFIMIRFGLPPDLISAALAGTTPAHDTIWDEAARIAVAAGANQLSVAAIMVALLNVTGKASSLTTAVKLDPADLIEGVGWITRLNTRLAAKRPIYGGIARDWAAGYTPTLSQFAQNLSRQVESARSSLGQQERTNQLDTLISGLSSATASVVVVGETGIGKTALLYGLADRILQGENAGDLRHNQVVSLSASTMLAQVTKPGDLERIVLTILTEAVGAGNIVVALDEAQLFFGQGTGAVNLSQILLPVVQSRRLRLILTLTPGDWQRLRSTNNALAGLLTPVVLNEPSPADTLRLLADRALSLESNGRTIVTYQALGRADAMSGRYLTDEANPGRSLKLLEASLNFADGQLITAASVDRAVESQFGVKVQQADAGETDTLLHLEDHIHQRMINQTRAVSVVSAALRRARAGVSNPKRPIGSFLFLGPTGVGKTELAKSVAALYFGAETSLIRLDMSEYQQATDVSRLLASAAENPSGLLPKIKQQPFSVVLFDEIEKANPNILNLLLQLLDEGNLTDVQNKSTSFKDAIIIATSNAGADDIRKHIEAGEQLEQFEQQLTDQLIASGSFKPELLNRFDEIVLFRPLNEAELGQVVGIMLAEVNKTLQPQKVSVELTAEATVALVHAGYDPRLGARPMRRMVQRTVEDAVAGKILRGEASAGTVIKLDLPDLNLAKPATS